MKEHAAQKAICYLAEGGVRVRERLSPSSAAEVQRILDPTARRLLAEQLDRDALAASTTGMDDGLGDDGADDRALLVDRELVPVASANADGGTGGRP
jgi:hypothetical protein